MKQNVAALLFVHHDFTFLFVCLLIARNTYNQMHIGEEFFGLFEYARMTNVVHVENAIGVNTNWVLWVETEVLGNRFSVGSIGAIYKPKLCFMEVDALLLA